MRQKILCLQKILQAPVRTFIREHSCDAHMNELPVPCGPWQPWYKDKQAFYTKILAFGAANFIIAVSVLISTNSLYLLFGPPCQPGPPSDMEEECSDAD